ncbi:MAG: hypothetical protein ACYDEV_06270 [Acidiferrobacter sp.]
MKISTYALHTMMALAATVIITTAQASMTAPSSMKNACGTQSHMTPKKACGPHKGMMKNTGSSKKSTMKNACGS